MGIILTPALVETPSTKIGKDIKGEGERNTQRPSKLSRLTSNVENGTGTRDIRERKSTLSCPFSY